ncbi:hypothetical protein [Hyphomicrobium sp. CS1GBMeth3]|uniref:hypothetical protein n=1 Tax=Hyphomicrobium sp. CS1GBMeth3 TaxID=1892845 RepID=UPI000931C2BD|nr:hypothetical protein [Hyphomicrobium sp. CS1GBMeth3]
MSLLAEIGSALRDALGAEADVFPAATLHKASMTLNTDGAAVRTFADHAGRGFVSRWDHKIMAAKGYDPKTAKIVIVQGETPKPELGDEISATRPLNETVERYTVVDVTSDPADATWQVAGMPV